MPVGAALLCLTYTRLEQELKYIFLENLRNESSLFYSVETPTKGYYKFSDKAEPAVCDESKDGYMSARIDVSVYEDEHKKPCNHIEFKYGQPESKAFPIQKDLLKLLCEDDSVGKNYFVHYIVTKSKQDKTKSALFEKFHKAIKNLEKNDKFSNRSDKVMIFVGFMTSTTPKGLSIYKFTVKDVENMKAFERFKIGT